jgi:hypothetical protein
VNLITNAVRRFQQRGPAWLLGLLLFVLCAGAARGADGRRFLFIVDVSSGMKPLDAALRETLFDLIYSGARGQMTNGDTYGLWLAGDKLDTSFPMETWKEKFAVELGAKAVSHVKDRGLKGRANLLPAFVDMNRVVKNVGDLTVILISNGETPLTGTPYDEFINARTRELVVPMKAKKATINTVLVAQEGKFVAWAVNSPQFLIEIPHVAVKPKPAKVEPPVARPAVVAQPAKVTPPPPRVAANPIIITRESVAEERRSYVSSATTTNAAPSAAVVAAPTNVLSSAPLEMTNALVSLVTNAPGLTNQPKMVVETSAPTNALAVVAAPVVTNSIQPASVVPAEVTLPLSAPTPERNLSFILLCVGAGAGGAFFIVLCVLLLGRSRRREPSLISQAIAREQMQAR